MTQELHVFSVLPAILLGSIYQGRPECPDSVPKGQSTPISFKLQISLIKVY